MVTRGTPERLPAVATAITCFQKQTYANVELIIVTDATDPDAPHPVPALVDSMGAVGVRTAVVGHGMTLGALRNLSVHLSSGAFLCQWDDDDLHHPERVTEQMARLTNSDAKAVLLQDVLQYYPVTKRLWWTNWHATEASAHPGTLLCSRDADISYPEAGDESRRGEDLAVARRLIAKGELATLADQPHLYVYISHGKNTYDMEHHQMLSDRLSVSRGRIVRREFQLRSQLAAFGSALDGASLVAPNLDGAVFQISTAG
ncbi:MAG TPA: glycosyltransferase family A protein [Steroidobacteraceae bacterium]|jgi:glycosyltransferase involved in cell wall biosynthesis